MRTAGDWVSELDRLRESIEDQWTLPWTSTPLVSPFWSSTLMCDLLAASEPVLIETSRALLGRHSFALRGVALLLIAERKLEDLADNVMDHLQDPSVHVRALAAHATGTLQFREFTFEALLDTKDSEKTEVKKIVVDAFRRLRDTRCIPLLARWVGRVGEDDQLRSKVCAAMGVIADEAALPALARVIDDDTVGDEVRIEASKALASIGGSEPRTLLEKAASARKPKLRCAAARALGELGDRGSVPTLRDLFQNDADATVRAEAAVGLFRLARSEAPRILRDGLSGASPEMRQTILDHLSATGETLDLESPIADDEARKPISRSPLPKPRAKRTPIPLGDPNKASIPTPEPGPEVGPIVAAEWSGSEP